MAVFMIMPDDPPPLRIRVRRCTIHAGRFRWDVVEGNRAVRSSPNSFLTREEASADGQREIEKFRSGGGSQGQ
jgi:hypothetical protein